MEVMARYSLPATAATVAAEESEQPPTIDTVDDEGTEAETAEPLQREYEQHNAAEEEMLQEIPIARCPAIRSRTPQ